MPVMPLASDVVSDSGFSSGGEVVEEAQQVEVQVVVEDLPEVVQLNTEYDCVNAYLPKLARCMLICTSLSPIS